jgi:osmoprotectant transport system permease protein
MLEILAFEHHETPRLSKKRDEHTMSDGTFFAEHRAEILGATVDHLALVVISMIIAILIAVPLGMFIVQRPALRAMALGIANIFQTIPSLALFGFLIPIPFIGGIGKRTAIVALVLYALLPILRNTYVGLTALDPAVLEAAEAMGMTPAQILFRVRFPLALAVILAGIRTATIITIGIATIAAAIGAGGLGTFIFRGVALVNDSLILAGAIPAAGLALLADFFLGLVERRLKVS